MHRVRGTERDPSGRVPVHQLGFITITGTEYALIDTGAWSGSRPSYQPGEVVTDASVQYVCVLAHTAPHEPPNGTYWDIYKPKERILTANRTWEKNGVANDFVEASGGFTNIASDAGAPSSPSPVSVPISIDRQSPGSADTYFITTATVDYLTIAKPGTYTVRAIASFPQGMSGYISAAADIAGDAYLYVAVAPGYIPASFSGAGGGVVVWEQTIEVLDTAVVGTATEVGVFPVVWQNSGSNRSGIAYIQVLRHT